MNFIKSDAEFSYICSTIRYKGICSLFNLSMQNSNAGQYTFIQIYKILFDINLSLSNWLS